MISRRVDELELLAATAPEGRISVRDFVRSETLLSTKSRSRPSRDARDLLAEVRSRSMSLDADVLFTEVRSRLMECGDWKQAGRSSHCYPFLLRDNGFLEVNADVDRVFKDIYLFLLLTSYVTMNSSQQKAGGTNATELFEEVTQWALQSLFGPRMQVRMLAHRGTNKSFVERLGELFAEIGLAKTGSRQASRADKDGDIDLVAWLPWGTRAHNPNQRKRGSPFIAVVQCKTGQQFTAEIAAAQSRGRRWFSLDELTAGCPLFVFAVSAQPDSKIALECSAEALFLDRCRHIHAISLDGMNKIQIDSLLDKMRSWMREILAASEDLPPIVRGCVPSWW